MQPFCEQGSGTYGNVCGVLSVEVALQVLYDAAKPSPDILDEIGLPPVSAEQLSSAQASIAGFFQQLRNVESLAKANTGSFTQLCCNFA